MAANLIGADISGYFCLLGMTWLLHHNLDVMWWDRKWYWRSSVTKGNDPVLLENLAEFYTSMRTKSAQLYKVTVVYCRVSTVGLAAMLTGEPTTPTEFEALVNVFLANDAWGLSVHSLQDLVI